MIRSIRYHWRIDLAIALAAAVATGVLTGALLVGDSVRGSLRDLVLDRLGKIDQVILSENYFSEQLAANLHSVAAIFLQGSASAERSNARASRVQIHGVRSDFAALFATQLDFAPSNGTPSVVINESLQKELRVARGDNVLLSFARPSDVHRESLLGRKDPGEMVSSLRCTVSQILPDKDIGRFGIAPNQNFPLNAFVSLSDLQKSAQQQERANAILISDFWGAGVSARQDLDRTSVAGTEARPPDRDSQDIPKQLRAAWSFEDVGLTIQERADSYSVESREIFLKPDLARKIEQIAARLQMPVMPVFTYLANEITANGHTIPYSIVAGLDLPAPPAFSALQLLDGSTVSSLQRDEILLNTWAANDLAIQEGQYVDLSYYVVGSGSRLIVRRVKFRVRGTAAIQGLGADRNLAPEYPGIQDAERISEWSPPFPIDLNLIRPNDEQYWAQYRATPKAFISLETAQQLWGSRFGNLTSIRLGRRPGIEAEFRKYLLASLSPAEAGFVFVPVKEQGLRAAEGSTDFSGLFLGFSIFLIVSAVLLVALLFRLAIEQRSNQVGLLLAVGYPFRRVLWLFLLEGMVLAAAGCGLGLLIGLAYAWVLLKALQTLWISAIGAPFVSLHINPLSLSLAFLISFVVIVISIRRSIRSLASLPVPSLLSGAAASYSRPITKRFAWLPPALLIAAVTLLVYANVSEGGAVYFFLMGACMLASGIGFFWQWLRTSQRVPLDPKARGVLLRMASRNSVRNPSRSIISMALVCCATFVIVAVGANRKDPSLEKQSKTSGTGGFALLAETDVPLLRNLNDSDARFEFGLAEEDLRGSRIYSFRVLPGEDASCLNLYRPEKPSLLGAAGDFLGRDGFHFRSTTNHTPDPWKLLERSTGDDVIPAIGDYNSVTWILHKKLGEEIVMTDEYGKPVRLRIVALLDGSIFQSQLLISESNFVRHFPSVAGYAFFLIEAPKSRMSTISQMLENALSSFGMDVASTEERLAQYQAVENTYLSTFQLLGGLGLLLGTLGLGIILVRNVLERRRELAGLQAFGYTRSKIAFLITTEHFFLLLVGLLLGSVCALAAVSPHLIAQREAVPWVSLLTIMAIIMAMGMIVTLAATSSSLKTDLMTALRQE